MAISHKSPTSATDKSDDQFLSEGQLLKDQERTNSPPFSRAVFYNPNEKTTQVRRAKNIDKTSYQEIKIPASNWLVTIYVDAETESKPTTKAVEDGRSNIVLTQLHLNRVGFWGQILRRVGLLSTCYVMNAPPLSEASSQMNLRDAS